NYAHETMITTVNLNTMKKVFFGALISFVACKKPGDSISTVSVQVKEVSTGQPVAGATVALRRCADLGCSFGLVVEFQGTTDNNGICQVPTDKYNKVPDWNDAILVSKANYFLQAFSKSVPISVPPYGSLRVRIIRGTNYPQ